MTTIVSEFSSAGPCLTLGRLVSETPRFYVYQEWRGGDRYDEKTRRIMKRTADHYSPAHVVACPSCRDHERTQYPNGYDC